MNKISLSILGILSLAVVLAVGGLYVQATDDDTPAAGPEPEEVVNERLNIKGLTDGRVDSFKGIPYAEAPVGDLRFAPPVPKAPWTGTLDCTEFGPSAVQVPSDKVGETSEDCLYLNVWAPAGAQPGDKLPVYMWIHGGAWLTGSGSKPTMDGTAFAEDGIVVVTINYRLSMLGYLSLDILEEKYGTSGNFGMMDQLMALQWVHDNISAFGGDPGQVTVGGESAGSVSTFNLILCRQAEGLFQQAIMESGAFVNAFSPMLNCDPDNARDIGKRIMKELCLEDNEEGLAELRKIDANLLWNLCSNPLDVLVDKPYAFSPLFDGKLLPREPVKALEEGRYNKDVKVIIGNNGHEGDMFSMLADTEYDIPKFLVHALGWKEGKAVMDLYGDDSRPYDEVFHEIVGLTLFQVPITMAQDLMSSHGTRVYAYEFEYTASGKLPPIHGAEIMFAFDNLESMLESPDATDRAVADDMHTMWANFIKTGDPNMGEPVPCGVQWEPYTGERSCTMHITEEPFFGEKTLCDRIYQMIPHYNLIR